MIEFINVLFKYDFLKNALLVGMLASIACGIIGTYIVYKKMVFISSSISHASFGGIGIGLYLIYMFNLPIKDPMIFALFFSLLSGVFILILRDNFNIENDMGIGIIMSLGMALGIIFSFMVPGYQSDVSTYLFGNILLSSKSNINVLFILDIIIILTFIVFYKGIMYSSFDEAFYKIYGIPITFINYLMVMLISAAIILNTKTIGIILIISILTTPQAIASMLTKKYINIMLLSIVISFLGIFIGLYMSYRFNLPSGPSIIISLIGMLLLAKIYDYIKNKIKNN